MLARYNNGATCNKVHVEMENDTMDTVDINKVWSKPNAKNLRTRPNQIFTAAGSSRQARPRGPFCPACYYLSQQLQTAIHFKHFKHLPVDCPRKSVAINMLKMEDSEHFETGGKSDYSSISLIKNPHNY